MNSTKIVIFTLSIFMICDTYALHKKGQIEPNLQETVQPEAFDTIDPEASSVMGQQAEENNSQFARVLDNSSHDRFIKIEVDANVAANEIDFWVRQLSEHALFLHLGIEDKQLKKEAHQLHIKFENFRRKFKTQYNNIAFMNSVLPLIEKEREFKVRVLSRLEAGEWLGWIFPLFVNHTILELDYLVDKLNGIPYTFEQELVFWNRINSEHALFASHLLDPKERNFVLAADALAQKFNQTGSEYDVMLRLSLSASKELDAFNKKARSAGNSIHSLIHPVLLDHVIREGERSIKTLDALKTGSDIGWQWPRKIEKVQPQEM